jgi:nicotinamide phosphoribosyltransferase
MSFKINPLLLTDGYKTSHRPMYPKGTQYVYSNYTCRNTKWMHESCKEIVVFGTQYVFKYIHDVFNDGFFTADKVTVCNEAKTYLNSYLNTNYDVSHFEALYDLGYLPIHVKALEEGTVIGPGVPLFTIINTHPDFFWVTNFLETLISTLIWKPVHSASVARGIRKILNKYADETGIDSNFVPFQGHDFSFRGMQAPDAAISSALGFLTHFMGSDTLPVLQAAKYYYNSENVAFSVPASEHSVMCAHGKEGEIHTLEYLMDQFPTGILSVVSDTWNLFQLITEYLPQLKERILARDGKLVIRPDSGDPADILCGLNTIVKFGTYEFHDLREEFDSFHFQDNGIFYSFDGEYLQELYEEYSSESVREDINTIESLLQHNIIKVLEKQPSLAEQKGVIELLWDVFGGTTNDKGYKMLDSHIGAIYGDSITPERIVNIAERLKEKGFANQVVYGIGSYTMGLATRDNQGGAVKSTFVTVNGEDRPIFKDPITDSGTKKSAKGLLKVNESLHLEDNVSWEEEATGLLKPFYKNGVFLYTTTIDKIRQKLQ